MDIPVHCEIVGGEASAPHPPTPPPSSPTPLSPDPFSHRKWGLETTLHNYMCARGML